VTPKRQQKNPRPDAAWTVEPIAQIEQEQLVEQILSLLEAARRRLLAPERSIQ
jgi:hypothetical protein